MSIAIDADELKRILNQDEDYDVYSHGWSIGFSLENLERIIDNMLTVDLVKHGYWIKHQLAQEYCERLVDNYQCSNCHCWIRQDYIYCPDCGSKMDEVNECDILTQTKY